MSKQPALFDFKPSEKLRNSGFTAAEEREVIGFCLSDNYPRSITVERTGTSYTLNSAEGAHRLLRALKFGTEANRKHMTVEAQHVLPR